MASRFMIDSLQKSHNIHDIALAKVDVAIGIDDHIRKGVASARR